MFTRKQYMNRECTHREYYGQFVDDYVKSRVQLVVGKETILESADENLNDIPIHIWDSIMLYTVLADRVKAAGDTISLAGQVCICKEAARQIQEAYRAETA